MIDEVLTALALLALAALALLSIFWMDRLTDIGSTMRHSRRAQNEGSTKDEEIENTQMFKRIREHLRSTKPKVKG